MASDLSVVVICQLSCYIASMTFSPDEIRELLKAWFALSLAFTIIQVGIGGSSFVNYFVISGLTVGIAFLVHELSHKFLAQKYGCLAFFQAFDLGLILAVGGSFFGFIFAAPGAVMISGVVSQEENGKIAGAGPISNLILATGFWLLGQIFGQNILFSAGFQINSWLAFFNLLPVWQLDGLKVMNWDAKVWGILIAVAGVLTFLV